MAALELSFLGPPQIVLDGERLELSRRKALALLAYLSVSRERKRRDTLATLFWPDSGQSQARQALRRDLAILNRGLGGTWIDAERESIGLVSGYWLDLAHFEQNLAAAAANPATRAERLAAAIDLYRDDFLKGFTLAGCPEFDEWQFFQAERLRGSFAAALEQLAETLMANDDAEGAVSHLRRRVTLDPLHEPAHRALMQVYAQTGQRAAALRQYELCRQLLSDELGVEPARETVRLYTAIRDRKITSDGNGHAAVAFPSERRHNLPAAATPFIGRVRELTDLGRLLDDPAVRLVTILGPGGMGKTRLALEAAERYLDRTDDRALFVVLAPFQTGEEVVSAIADAAGYTFLQDARTTEEQLLDYLRQKQLLIVLDNTEYLGKGADVIQAILETAARVKVLATSRERLQLSAETVFALGGMPYHRWATVEEALANDTVRLFVQGARRARPGFELAAEDLAPLDRICRGLGGMPLGVLLAAAWVDLLTPAEIAAEIDRSQDLLATRLRDVPERQRSIRAVFEYAWSRLDTAERIALMKLSYFQGGFSREAARAAGGASLRTLSVLADKSLLQREAGGRYAIHELLRQYARAELQSAGQATATAGTHSAYYASFLAQRERDLKEERQKAAIDEIEADLENIRLAWERSIEQGDVIHMAQAFDSLGLYYDWRGRFQEGERAFARMAARLGDGGADDSLRPHVRARVWQARFSRGLGQDVSARGWLRQTMSLLDSVSSTADDTRPERADLLTELGYLAYDAGDRSAATSCWAQSLDLCRELNDRWRQAKVLLAIESVYRNLHGLGSAEEHQRQTEKSQQLVLESLAIFRELGDQANAAAALYALGVTLLTLGRAKQAQPAFQECIALCNDLGSHGETYIDAIGYLAIAGEMLGLYAAMRARAQTIISLAEDGNYLHGLRLGYLLTGGAALAEGVYSEAEGWFARSVGVSRQMGRAGNLAFGLTGWALASYWLGNRSTARRQLIEALEIASEIGTIRAAVHGILCGALLRADQGDMIQALELHALATSFPFAGDSRWCQDVAGRHVLAVTVDLPPDVVVAARERGRQRDVWETVEELLALFVEDGPDR